MASSSSSSGICASDSTSTSTITRDHPHSHRHHQRSSRAHRRRARAQAQAQAPAQAPSPSPTPRPPPPRLRPRPRTLIRTSLPCISIGSGSAGIFELERRNFRNVVVREEHETVWQMTLQPPEGMDAPQGQFPERTGEPDCTYYMRTGLCGFGMSCRFNHPPNRKLAAAVARGKGEYPERHGQPECQYYLKTGTCKFGSTCKYHHPREKAGSTGRVQLNVLGLPLRQGEKECAYYMRTGSCKYNITCKFHHPSPTAGSVLVPISAAPIYATAGAPSMPAPQYPGGLPSWPVARAPYIPSPRIQGPSNYGPPMLLPAQGIVSMPGWSTYQGPVGAVASPEGQQHPMGTGYVYTQQSDPVVGSVHGTYPSYMPGSSGMGLPALQPQQSLGGSHNNNKEMIFPERPGQPECQYYMKTGDCKFGITCKYHHPKDRATPSPTCGLSPLGLPLRPGAQPCTFYARYGICKFGPTCKFDHPVPVAGLPYSPSASSLTDMPVAPYPLGGASSNLAASSSSDAPFDPMATGTPSAGASTSNLELPTNVNTSSLSAEGPSSSIHTQTREGSISSSEAAAQTNNVTSTPTTPPPQQQQQQQQQQAGQSLSLQGLSLGSGGGSTKQQQQQQAVDMVGSS